VFIVAGTHRLVWFFNYHINVYFSQPPPEVYEQFDEVMLLSEGQIFFHGSRHDVLPYFESLGYFCPKNVDPADFLQELPTAEGKQYIRADCKDSAPRGTDKLVEVWKACDLYARMMDEVNSTCHVPTELDVETGKDNIAVTSSTIWHHDMKEAFPGSYWYHFQLSLKRQATLTLRDNVFIQTRIGQSIFTAILTGTLFLDVKPSDVLTMNGLLFYTMLSSAMGSFSVSKFDQ
jgi:hypothetical protein